MGWTVPYDELLSISALNNVLVDFFFFQITSNYLIPCFPRSPSGETTTNLEGSTFTRPSTLLFFVYDQTIAFFCRENIPSCYSILM